MRYRWEKDIKALRLEGAPMGMAEALDNDEQGMVLEERREFLLGLFPDDDGEWHDIEPPRIVNADGRVSTLVGSILYSAQSHAVL